MRVCASVVIEWGQLPRNRRRAVARLEANFYRVEELLWCIGNGWVYLRYRKKSFFFLMVSWLFLDLLKGLFGDRVKSFFFS